MGWLLVGDNGLSDVSHHSEITRYLGEIVYLGKLQLDSIPGLRDNDKVNRHW